MPSLRLATRRILLPCILPLSLIGSLLFISYQHIPAHLDRSTSPSLPPRQAHQLIASVPTTASFLPPALDSLPPQRVLSKSEGGLTLPASYRVLKQNASPASVGQGSFRDRLLPTETYITTFFDYGLNNQIITLLNLLHLTYLLSLPPYPSHVIPILPPFFPSFAHLRTEAAPLLAVGEVFDLERFKREMGWKGIVEWDELREGRVGKRKGHNGGKVVRGKQREKVKTERGRYRGADGSVMHPMTEQEELEEDEWVNDGGPNAESLGCWLTLPDTGHVTSWHLSLNVSLTPLPRAIRTPRSDTHVLLPAVADFLFPSTNVRLTSYLSQESREVQETIQQIGYFEGKPVDEIWGKGKEGWVPPETGKEGGEVVCFNFFYYASERGEDIHALYEDPLIGPWNTVGRHLHFTARVRQLAEDSVRSILGIPPVSSLPNFITMHIRRGDFKDFFADPSHQLPALVEALGRLHSSLSIRGEKDVTSWPVIVATNEQDEQYLRSIRDRGWMLIDHDRLRTREKHGDWWPSVLDNVILSLGTGFIGTKSSTMSILAYRRVEDAGGIAVNPWPLEEIFQ